MEVKLKKTREWQKDEIGRDIITLEKKFLK